MKLSWYVACVLCAVAQAVSQPAPAEEDGILGLWQTADGKACVEIARCGEKYCGKIVWLKEPLKDGKPVVDDKNPEEAKRARPVLGLAILRDFEYDGDNVWTGGKVYDPESGNDYSAKMTLEEPSLLDLRGYVLVPLFGRTSTWTRWQGSLPPSP